MADNFFAGSAVSVERTVEILPDFYAEGGSYDPLANGAGPHVPIPRADWPAPTIPQGGTPPSFLEAGRYPFNPSAGIPKNMSTIKEEPTSLSERIDAQVRPRQLVDQAQLMLPYIPGDGQRYRQGDKPLDPSVIKYEERHNGAKAFMAFDTFSTGRGMGQFEPLLQLALIPIQATMNSLQERENELSTGAPDVYRAAVAPYAAVVKEVYDDYNAMVADPSRVAELSPAFAAAAATYKTVLDQALTKWKDAQKKAAKADAAAAAAEKARVTAETVRQLPAAVVQTATSPYGIAVLVIGGLVVAGLLFMRSRK